VGQGPASKFFLQNNICMRAVDYSQDRATTLAAESLRAQLHSQCKLTTPRHENRKNWTRKRTFKSKRTHSWCLEMSDLSNDTKKHTSKSHETIPLKQDFPESIFSFPFHWQNQSKGTYNVSVLYRSRINSTPNHIQYKWKHKSGYMRMRYYSHVADHSLMNPYCPGRRPIFYVHVVFD
jgi:hypothetical protein